MKIYKTKEYYIAAADGKLLTVGEDDLVTVEQKDDKKAQLWKFVPETNNNYRIINVQSKKALDIIAGGSVNGAWIHQWEVLETPSQLWNGEEEEGAVRLRSVSSDKYLDVALEDNTHVQIWERGGVNQLWKLETAEKPKTPKKETSTAIKSRESGAIKMPDPTAIKEKEPSAIKTPDPTSLKTREPAAIKPAGKTSSRKGRGKRR